MKKNPAIYPDFVTGTVRRVSQQPTTTLSLTDRQRLLLGMVKSFHGDQVRKYTNEPYWTHPLAVAEIVSKYIDKQYAVEIALCHDLFEDTPCDKRLLIEQMIEMDYTWGEAKYVADRVTELTDVYTKEAFPALNRAERKRKEAFRLGSVDFLSQSIKYADLIDNTKSIVEHDPGFARVYLAEKLQVLEHMRCGDIRLFVECCAVYADAVRMLNTNPLGQLTK